MTREDAIARIMEESQLTANERAILIFLVYRTNDDRISHVRVSDVSRGTGIDRRTVSKSIAYLVDRQYVASLAKDVYRPFPYIHKPQPGEKTHKTHNTRMSLTQATILLADVTEKVAELTALCEVARANRDKKAEKNCLDQIDVRLDVLESLQNFLATNRKDMIKKSEFYTV